MNIEAQSTPLLEQTLASLDAQIQELATHRGRIAAEINRRQMEQALAVSVGGMESIVSERGL